MFIRTWVWCCGTQHSIVLAKQNGLNISPIMHRALANKYKIILPLGGDYLL